MKTVAELEKLIMRKTAQAEASARDFKRQLDDVEPAVPRGPQSSSDTLRRFLTRKVKGDDAVGLSAPVAGPAGGADRGGRGVSDRLNRARSAIVTKKSESPLDTDLAGLMGD